MSKKSEAEFIARIKSQGTYFLPSGGITTEMHLAAFLDLSRRSVIDHLVYPEGQEGVQCLPVGARFLVRVDDLEGHIELHGTTRHRPGRKGGIRKGETEGEPPCDAKTPCGKSG